MASTQLSPLHHNVPIVSPEEGTPTPGFAGDWQRLLEEKGVTDDLAAAAAPETRQVVSGAGLTGGGDLTADRTLAVGAGTGITVNANDVAIDTTAEAERIRDVIGAALVAGSNITITVNDAGDTITIASAATGGGGMTLISKTVTSSSATNVSFTSIPATYSGLQLKVFARGTKTATSVDVRVRFNGDTGNDYDLAFGQGGGTPANVAQLSPTPSPAALYIGDFAAASAPANVADTGSFDIFGYASTAFHKSMVGLVTHKIGNSSTANIMVAFIAGWWRNTAAISQIDVFPSSGAFVDGSIVALYGIA